jgi:hypothetical protein
MNKNLRKLSKEEFNLPREGNPTLEEVRTSCLMRIADASETIAKNYNALLAERDQYEKWFREEQNAKAILIKRVSALKGVITKLKNKKGEVNA